MLWNTTGTVEALGRGYRIAAENAIADIEPEWVPARIGIEGNLYNAVQESCRVLMPEAPPAAQHRLATRIRVSRSA